MSRRRVVVTVDRLVVAGLPEGPPGRIAAQIRDAVSAALAGLEAPSGLTGAAVSLPTLTVTLPAGTAPGRIGAAVADALSGALTTAAAQTGSGIGLGRAMAAPPPGRPAEPGRAPLPATADAGRPGPPGGTS